MVLTIKALKENLQSDPIRIETKWGLRKKEGGKIEKKYTEVLSVII